MQQQPTMSQPSQEIARQQPTTSQSAEEMRYHKNQAAMRQARKMASKAPEKRYTTVFVGPSCLMPNMTVDEARSIHNASPIYNTDYTHMRPAKSDVENGVKLDPEVDQEIIESWVDRMEEEYGELLEGEVDSKVNGFLDAADFSNISPKGLETKRKLFGKGIEGAKTEESQPGSGNKNTVVTLKRKAEDIESPFRDKKAYREMRSKIPARVKDRLQIEADIWLEHLPDIPTSLSEIQDSLDQMHIYSKYSPPTLSDGSTATPETVDTDEEDNGNEDAEFLAMWDLVPDEQFGSWKWKSSKHPTKGFVRREGLGYEFGLVLNERAGKFREEERSQFQLNFGP